MSAEPTLREVIARVSDSHIALTCTAPTVPTVWTLPRDVCLCFSQKGNGDLADIGREVSQWYIILGIFSSCTSPLLRRTVHLADVLVDQLLGFWVIQVDGEAVLGKK